MKRLIVDGYGKYVGSSGDRIVVKEKGKTITQELPENLRSVVISGKCSISSDAIISLARSGTDLLILDFKGDVVARLSFGMFRTVKTRREQYLGYYDVRGVTIAKIITMSKLYNQRYLLYTFGKRREDLQSFFSERIKEIDREIKNIANISSQNIDSIRGTILSAEGRGANSYWEGIKKILPDELNFQGRIGRGAVDPFNSALNYGYALLQGEVTRAIHFSGLDPFGGFLHVDRPGKPSLTLDLMEMFRQQCVDRVLLSLITKKAIKTSDFHQGPLNEKVRKIILKEILSKFETYVRIEDIKIRWTDLMLDKAREIAKFLRGEIRELKPFYLRW